jgi:hypothetical protein
MRNSRNAIAALALALVLSTPTFAGIMITEIAPPPPPPTTNSQSWTGVTEGIINTDAAASAPGVTDSTTEIALNLLQSVLALF